MKRFKDRRRARAAKKALTGLKVTPKPEWVEAFMILLLYKTGGTLTVSLADLNRFELLKSNNRTLLSFGSDQTVTIRMPEIELPESIFAPESKIITGLN